MNDGSTEVEVALGRNRKTRQATGEAGARESAFFCVQMQLRLTSSLHSPQDQSLRGTRRHSSDWMASYALSKMLRSNLILLIAIGTSRSSQSGSIVYAIPLPASTEPWESEHGRKGITIRAELGDPIEQF